MQELNYTLANYYEEAAVVEYPDWAKHIRLWNRYKNKPLKPYWSQVQGLNMAFSFDNQRCALYDDMGSGKTLVSQGFAVWHAAYGNRVVIIMPKALLGQYHKNLFGTFIGLESYITCERYHAPKAKRDQIVQRWESQGAPKIVLTTYDLFLREWMIFKALGFQVLVMDEAKVLSNVDNKTTVAINKFMGPEGERAALVMQGTPARNDLRNLHGYIDFVTPGVYRNRTHFELKHVEFEKINVKMRDRRTGEEVQREVKVPSSFKNLEELYKSLYKQARRVEKKDVLDIPGKQLIEYEVELSDKHRRLYNKLVEERLLILEDNTVLDALASSAARNLAMQAVLHTDMLQLNEDSAYLEMVDEIIDEIGLESTKVFITCHYRKTVELYAKRYAKYEPAVIYGDTKNVEAEKERFLNDPNCRILVANYVSGGVGLDLQEVCYNMVVGEPTGVPGDFDQATDRIDRGGQEHKCMIHVPIPAKTVFASTVASMLKKKQQVKSVVSRAELRAELLGDIPDTV